MESVSESRVRGKEETIRFFYSTNAQWPKVSSRDQESLVDLLCNAISPIGLHRTNHCIPSKGKKDKKRKRGLEIEKLTVPLPPLISGFVIVGLNNIVRRLESMSHKSRPQSVIENDDAGVFPGKHHGAVHEKNEHFAAIFVVSPSTHPTVQLMLPQLVHTASIAHPGLPKTRLIQLSKGSEDRICLALSLPRTSCVGILTGALQAENFMKFVQDCVPVVQVPWLEDNSTVLSSSTGHVKT